MSAMAGKISAQYDEPWSIRVSSSIPTMAIASPGSIRTLGPTRGSSRDTNPAARMMPRLNGRKAKPALSGL
jgi:hypothetical protein